MGGSGHVSGAPWGDFTMWVIGLMSGTSLDGCDVALVDIQGWGTRLQAQLLDAATWSLPESLRARIAALYRTGLASVAEVAGLDVALGEHWADLVLRFLSERGLRPEQIDLIGVAGQTVWHQPCGPEAFTFQLGEPAVIAARTGITTVGEFRVGDVARQGQGAPLVPYVDWLCWGRSGESMAMQNFGGIGNVTCLSADGDPAKVLAFDTGPGCMVIDALVEDFSGGAQRWDDGGLLAKAGRVQDELLSVWLAADDYLRQPLPKSTGRERYGAAFVERLKHQAEGMGVWGVDLIATATAYTAACVADQYRRFLPAGQFPRTVWVSGGGARNPALLDSLVKVLPECRVCVSDELGINADHKEAFAFAILAYQAVHGQINQLPHVTGASHSAVLGQIVPGNNWGRGVLAGVVAGTAQLLTEASNPVSSGLDRLNTRSAVQVMHSQDYDVLRAIDTATEAIAAVIDDTVARLRDGGRLIYVGAGTSGRLGVLDASECYPTFSVPQWQVQGIVAGGDRALRHAIEGAEDDASAGAADVNALTVGLHDIVVGISANGHAQYVWGALAAARAAEAATVLLTCNQPHATPFVPDHVLVLPVGPEIVAGSTRLKAGSATKMVLNMITTLTMVQLGKVYDNLMVDVQCSNQKLRQRARRLVAQLTREDDSSSQRLLDTAGGSVKRAVVMHQQGVDAVTADRLLTQSGGHLRPWMQSI